MVDGRSRLTEESVVVARGERLACGVMRIGEAPSMAPWGWAGAVQLEEVAAQEMRARLGCGEWLCDAVLE